VAKERTKFCISHSLKSPWLHRLCPKKHQREETREKVTWAFSHFPELTLSVTKYLRRLKGAFLWENPNLDSFIQKPILRFFT